MCLQFEDPSDARLSDEEARRKIMQRTLTGAALCAHLACLRLLGGSASLVLLWTHTMAAYDVITCSHTVWSMQRHVTLHHTVSWAQRSACRHLTAPWALQAERHKRIIQCVSVSSGARACRYSWPFRPAVSREARDLVARMICVDVDKRITFEEIQARCMPCAHVTMCVLRACRLHA